MLGINAGCESPAGGGGADPGDEPGTWPGCGFSAPSRGRRPAGGISAIPLLFFSLLTGKNNPQETWRLASPASLLKKRLSRNKNKAPRPMDCTKGNSSLTKVFWVGRGIALCNYAVLSANPRSPAPPPRSGGPGDRRFGFSAFQSRSAASDPDTPASALVRKSAPPASFAAASSAAASDGLGGGFGGGLGAGLGSGGFSRVCVPSTRNVY